MFSALSRADIDRILIHSSVAVLPRGTILFHPGDRIRSFDMVLSGHVKIYRLSPDGNEAVVHIISENEPVLFNLSAPATNNETDYAETTGQTCLLRIDKPYLFKCMAENVELALSVLHGFAHQILDMEDEILRMKSMVLSRKLAHFLLSRCSRSSGPEIVFLPYEKTLLANKFGVTRESLSRAFQVLKQINITTCHNHVRIDEVRQLYRYSRLQTPNLR